MDTGFASLRFDRSDVRPFVPVRFGIVEKRNGVQYVTRGGRGHRSTNMIGHTNDRARVHTPAELSQNRSSRPRTALDRLLKECQKVFFVLCIGVVANLFPAVPIPVSLSLDLVVFDYEEGGCRNSSY